MTQLLAVPALLNYRLHLNMPVHFWTTNEVNNIFNLKQNKLEF